jgi:hypothetical protein
VGAATKARGAGQRNSGCLQSPGDDSDANLRGSWVEVPQ